MVPFATPCTPSSFDGKDGERRRGGWTGNRIPHLFKLFLLQPIYNPELRTRIQHPTEELDIVVDNFMHSLGSQGLKNRSCGATGTFQKQFLVLVPKQPRITNQDLASHRRVGHCCRWFHAQFGHLGPEKSVLGSYWHLSRAVSFVGAETAQNYELGFSTPQKSWTLLQMVSCTVWAARA